MFGKVVQDSHLNLRQSSVLLNLYPDFSLRPTKWQYTNSYSNNLIYLSGQSLNLTIYIILSRAAYVNRLLGKIYNLFASLGEYFISLYVIYRIRSISAEIERPSVASLLGCLGFRSKHTPSVHVYLRHAMLLTVKTRA